MPSYIERLQDEATELDHKVNKLDDFISSYKFCAIDETMRELMQQQLEGMLMYQEALNARLSIIYVKPTYSCVQLRCMKGV